MYCYKCGKQIPDDAEYCNWCGAKVSIINQELSEKTQNVINNNSTFNEIIDSHLEENLEKNETIILKEPQNIETSIITSTEPKKERSKISKFLHSVAMCIFSIFSFMILELLIESILQSIPVSALNQLSPLLSIIFSIFLNNTICFKLYRFLKCGYNGIIASYFYDILYHLSTYLYLSNANLNQDFIYYVSIGIFTDIIILFINIIYLFFTRNKKVQTL